MTVPSLIHAYWHSTQIPWLAARCLETMRSRNPDFALAVATRDDLVRLLAALALDPEIDALLARLDVAALNRLREANVYRLLVAYRDGGVWLDAHCICTAPLDTVFDLALDSTNSESLAKYGF